MLDWLFLVFSIQYCCPRCQAIEAARGSSAVLRVGKQSKTVKRKYKRPKYLRRPKADAGLGGEQDTTVAVKVPRCSQLFNRGTSVQPCPRQGPTTGRGSSCAVTTLICSCDARRHLLPRGAVQDPVYGGGLLGAASF